MTPIQQAVSIEKKFQLYKSFLSQKAFEIWLEEEARWINSERVFKNNFFKAEVYELGNHSLKDWNDYMNLFTDVNFPTSKLWEKYPFERYWNVGGEYQFMMTYSRKDLKPITDWSMHQFIKTEVGKAFDGVHSWEGTMLFPHESRLMDTANQYWMNLTMDMHKVGYWQQRSVVENQGEPILDKDGVIRLSTSKTLIKKILKRNKELK